jgi:hypothetical protein
MPICCTVAKTHCNQQQTPAAAAAAAAAAAFVVCDCSPVCHGVDGLLLCCLAGVPINEGGLQEWDDKLHRHKQAHAAEGQTQSDSGLAELQTTVLLVSP